MDDLLKTDSQFSRPFSPPSSNLINLIDKNKTVITEKNNDKVMMDFTSRSDNPQEEDKVELEYDPILNCYYDPKTNQYYAEG